MTQQIQVQGKQIYEKYNHGASYPASKVDLVAYQDADGSFFLGVVWAIPPQAALMDDLKREVPQKAQWGIQQGYIRRASPVQSIARDGFDGFCFHMENSKGTHDYVGGLTHFSRKGEVIQISMLGVKEGDSNGDRFEKLLASVRLEGNTNRTQAGSE